MKNELIEMMIYLYLGKINHQSESAKVLIFERVFHLSHIDVQMKINSSNSPIAQSTLPERSQPQCLVIKGIDGTVVNGQMHVLAK